MSGSTTTSVTMSGESRPSTPDPATVSQPPAATPRATPTPHVSAQNSRLPVDRATPMLPYPFTYGLPMAAGATARPTTPASTMTVST